ncbi:MAG: hypothetical protein KF860_13900 [Cyclobacteriaceae bacterium]|nr:hypothetical protein [Cyclobacteriaceae bacterium]
MLYITIALFAIAAVLGLIILLKWLSKNDAPKGVIYSHGIIAAIALVLITVYALQNPTNYPQFSIILFVLGALGGFYLFFTNLKSKTRPLGIAFVHALVAVAAFVALLIFTFV